MAADLFRSRQRRLLHMLRAGLFRNCKQHELEGSLYRAMVFECGSSDWDRIFDAVSKAYDGDLQMVDSSSIRVHQHAANVKKGARRKPAKGTTLQPDAWGARAAD